MACVAISHIVKQTTRVRTGNACRVATTSATGPRGEFPALEARLLMMRSASVMRGASLGTDGKMHASELPPYSLAFMPKFRAPDRAPLFRLGEIFRCHSRGCSRSLVRDTVQSLKRAQVCGWLPDSPRLRSLRLAWHRSSTSSRRFQLRKPGQFFTRLPIASLTNSMAAHKKRE